MTIAELKRSFFNIEMQQIVKQWCSLDVRYVCSITITFSLFMANIAIKFIIHDITVLIPGPLSRKKRLSLSVTLYDKNHRNAFIFTSPILRNVSDQQ